jgi:putative transposase
MMVRI